MDHELKTEILKLKYHVKQLYQASGNTGSYASLVIELDWNEDDISAAQDIFEKHSQLIEKGNRLNGGELERELRDRFSIGYHEVKHIVLVFFENSQWQDVCFQYAEQFRCVEFRKILDREND
jgi:hypothetical protein